MISFKSSARKSSVSFLPIETGADMKMSFSSGLVNFSRAFLLAFDDLFIALLTFVSYLRKAGVDVEGGTDKLGYKVPKEQRGRVLSLVHRSK